MAEAKLYIIGTPLGHRGDITSRAVEMLRGLSTFFAEDSREFAKLLELYGISPEGKKVYSYAKHNMKEATAKALGLLRDGVDLGLVTDRGTPGISDPGQLIVEGAREAGHEVLPVPGISSVTTLISVSGFPADRFVFIGFPPVGQKERHELWKTLAQLGWCACLFESPKRVKTTVEELATFFPTGRVFLGREMTKVFEAYDVVSLADWKSHEWVEKGEYALLLDPGAAAAPSESELDREITARLGTDKEWAKYLAEKYDLSSSQIYNALQRRKTET